MAVTIRWFRRRSLLTYKTILVAILMSALLRSLTRVRLESAVDLLGLLPSPSSSLSHPSVAYVDAGEGLSQHPFLSPESGANSSSVASYNYTLPLHTHGRYILDARDERVKLASINWYGGSDADFVPSGLDVQPRDRIAALIRDLGFNSVRLPYSDEMVRDNPRIPASRVAANMDLVHKDTGGVPAREVFTAVVESLTDAGLLVIVNNHITQATWCCGANPCDAGWANDWFGGRLFCRVGQTSEEWIENWETVMQPLANNSHVIGVDLRNEPRGLWGTLHWEDWAAAAERAAGRLLTLNPDWLIIVEGISSANDLSGVRRRPVRLPAPFPPDRVVYSAHVYSWSGWGSLSPYSRRTYDDFAESMRRNWAYLLEEDMAPVWVGELGTPDRPTEGDHNYWTNLVQFLREIDADWGYWALNPRKPSKDWESYGLVGDDWEQASVRWDYRLADMQRLGLDPSILPSEGSRT
jgi:endoglucanase